MNELETRQGSVKRSISMPEDLLRQAEARAATQKRNLSNYLQFLVSQDLSGDLPVAPAAQPEKAEVAA